MLRLLLVFFPLKILLIVLIYVWWLLVLGRAFSMYWGCLSQKEKYLDVRVEIISEAT